jgi:hypothetical protein
MSPLGTLTTIWVIVPAPDDRWWWVWSSWCNENWQGKPKYSEKTCPSATLSTTEPTWLDLGLNRGYCSGKPANNCLSYGMAFLIKLRNINHGLHLLTCTVPPSHKSECCLLQKKTGTLRKEAWNLSDGSVTFSIAQNKVTLVSAWSLICINWGELVHNYGGTKCLSFLLWVILFIFVASKRDLNQGEILSQWIPFTNTHWCFIT